MGSFGFFVLVVEELLVVDVLLDGRRVVDVRVGAVLVVAFGGCTVVVVVVGIVSARPGHAEGAGAFRAANFPGSSWRTSPPKSRQ